MCHQNEQHFRLVIEETVVCMQTSTHLSEQGLPPASLCPLYLRSYKVLEYFNILVENPG